MCQQLSNVSGDWAHSSRPSHSETSLRTQISGSAAAGFVVSSWRRLENQQLWRLFQGLWTLYLTGKAVCLLHALLPAVWVSLWLSLSLSLAVEKSWSWPTSAMFSPSLSLFSDSVSKSLLSPLMVLLWYSSECGVLGYAVFVNIQSGIGTTRQFQIHECLRDTISWILKLVIKHLIPN